MPRKVNFHLQEISRLRHGSGVDSLVLLAPHVTGRRYVHSLHAYREAWLSTRPSSKLLEIGKCHTEMDI